MKILTIVARILLGLAFVVFGLNGFLMFIPMPPPPPGHAGEFTGALFASGYLRVISGLQLAGGLLLWTGAFVPLGLLLLGPVLSLFLLASYWSAFAPIFRPFRRSTPTPSPTPPTT
jgi:putative oxidoreductase